MDPQAEDNGLLTDPSIIEGGMEEETDEMEEREVTSVNREHPQQALRAGRSLRARGALVQLITYSEFSSNRYL